MKTGQPRSGLEQAFQQSEEIHLKPFIIPVFPEQQIPLVHDEDELDLKFRSDDGQHIQNSGVLRPLFLQAAGKKFRRRNSLMREYSRKSTMSVTPEILCCREE